MASAEKHQDPACRPARREPLFTDVLQVAVVVRDLDASLRTYVYDYGIGPWTLYVFAADAVADLIKDDQPAKYGMRMAIAHVGTVEWELIEPLDDRSSYAEFL